MKVEYTPDALRAFADLIEVPAKIIRQVAADMETQGVASIVLQIKSPVSKHVKPLTKWADEDFRFDAAKEINRAAKEKAFREGGEAVRAHLDAEKAETPKPKGRGKKS